MRLDMRRPMKASNTVVFTLAPAGGATEVTWAMEGDTPFVAKIMHVFVNMDRLCGGPFEDGLASLKSIVEKTEA